jgi:hypothetical protein
MLACSRCTACQHTRTVAVIAEQQFPSTVGSKHGLKLHLLLQCVWSGVPTNSLC